MATEVETRKKISALPEVQTLDGFYTVGYKMVDGTPQSKKVNLTYVDTAAQNANTKANLAQEKATLADTKANLADQKASLADEKATLAAQKAALAEQAAGSVDTAKTAAQQAAASANSAASGATAAAAEADEAAEAATEAAAAAVATNTEVTEDEAARVLAETARASAEASRVSAETARSTSEGQRSSAESTRQTKETERQGSETARGTAEANRATAETARAQAEQARVSAESSRASAETARGTAETERASAETSRASSETSRASAETARASAESSRASAEASRVSAEEARAAAEEDRDEAEESRDTAETARATAESTRVESETARGTAETTRGINEAARVSAETARASAETTRGQNESARVQAEQSRASAEEERDSAEDDRAEAEEARVSAESARVSSESARASAETTRVSNETARAAAETTRGTNETARQTAEANRGTAETARATAESERASAETARASAETARVSAESSRASAETARVSAETARASAETARATAESGRVSAETARVAADALRTNAISGIDDLPVFNAETRYLAGTYCIKDGYVYRFTSTHEIGAWTGNDVVQTSVFGELKEMVVGDTEQVHINLSSSDGLLEVEGLEVEVSFDDGSATQMIAVDENGDCTVEIAKNKVYTLAVADQTGYQHCASFKSKANTNQRFVYFVYEKTISGETCTVTVSLVPSGARPEAPAQFVGKTVNLMLSNGTSRSTTTDANGVATFENVPRGVNGTTANPKVTGFVTPAAIAFSTNFATIGLTATYAAMTAPGIWMVKSNGDEVDYYSWDTSDTLVAIHVATQALADAGKDYYIPVAELESGWYTNAHNKQWATSNVNFPNVPNWNQNTPNYDGPNATQKMISDAAALSINSPAAELAVETYFTLKGITAQGYIGTRDQWQPLVDNSDMVAQMLTLCGKTPVWKSKNIWTSSQYSATNAWNWYSGSWLNLYKTSGTAVVPFFAI